MGKITDMKIRKNNDKELQKIVEDLEEVKDALAQYISEADERGMEEEKTDLLTEALDALEDAYDVMSEAME